MGLRVSELVLDCRDPELLARFWCGALGFTILGREPDGSVEVGPRSGFGGARPTLVLSPSADPRPPRGPLHLDLSPVRSTREAEVSRLLQLGARPADIGQTGAESWVVLQDPEGNVFCVLDRPVEPVDP